MYIFHQIKYLGIIMTKRLTWGSHQVQNSKYTQ